MHPTICLCTQQFFYISEIPLLLLLPFTFCTHSFCFFSSFSFILVRGKVLCVCFGQAASLTVVRRQVVVVVVVGVAVNGGGKLQLLLDLVFFAYKTYEFIILKLYKIYGLIIHKFYITYGSSIINLWIVNP